MSRKRERKKHQEKWEREKEEDKKRQHESVYERARKIESLSVCTYKYEWVRVLENGGKGDGENRREKRNFAY